MSRPGKGNLTVECDAEIVAQVNAAVELCRPQCSRSAWVRQAVIEALGRSRSGAKQRAAGKGLPRSEVSGSPRPDAKARQVIAG